MIDLSTGKEFRLVKAKIMPFNPHQILLEPQQKWCSDMSPRRFAVKPRQVGWTWMTGLDIVRDKAENTYVKDAWISSRDEIQAKLFLEDCKYWATLLGKVASDLGEVIFEANGKQFKAYVLEFPNGNRIHSMSSNPDAQAGKRGDRVGDEAALHKDFRQWFAIAKPGLTWGGRFSIFSTERGSSTYYHELRKEIEEQGNPKKFSFHKNDLREFLNYGFLWKLQQILPEDSEIQDMDEDEYFEFIRKGCDSEESFMQEYMCIAADDSAAFLEWDLITAAEYHKSEVWETPLDLIQGDLYMGVDIGRKHDLTSITLGEKLGDVKYTRRRIDLQKMKFSDQKAVIWPLLAHPKLRRACFDATGLGMQIAEEARQDFGSRVEEITFTQPIKEELAFGLRTAFEDRKLRIPYDHLLRNDLRNVRKEVTTAGKIRFVADVGPDGHSDRFWSYALMEHAGKSVTGPFEYVALTRNWVANYVRRRNRFGVKRGVEI